MRKSVIAILIAFSFAVVSCGGAKEVETEGTDSVEVVEVEVEATEEVLEGEVEATEEVVEVEVEG